MSLKLVRLGPSIETFEGSRLHDCVMTFARSEEAGLMESRVSKAETLLSVSGSGAQFLASGLHLEFRALGIEHDSPEPDNEL